MSQAWAFAGPLGKSARVLTLPAPSATSATAAWNSRPPATRRKSAPFSRPSSKVSCALILRSIAKRRCPVRSPFAASKFGMIEPAVALTGVTKIFPIPFQRRSIVAVRDLNLEVAAGQIYGLLGPNGSGKSTTLKIILGLVPPTRGQTKIFGRDSDQVASRESVGF